MIGLRRDIFLGITGILFAVSSLAGFFHYADLFYIMLACFGIILMINGDQHWYLNVKKIALFVLICFLSLLYRYCVFFISLRQTSINLSYD